MYLHFFCEMRKVVERSCSENCKVSNVYTAVLHETGYLGLFYY